MAQKFLIELYCHSDAQSIRNMIADVIQDGMIKEVVELSDEATQQSVQATKARCICVDFINCNPDPVSNPDCPIHGAGFCA